MLIDAIISIVKVKNIKSTLERVEKLNKEIKEKLKEIKGMKKDTDTSKSIENIQKLVNKLKRKRNRTIIHLYRNVNRLKKAFPTINTKEITEVLSKKMDIKKLKKKEKINKILEWIICFVYNENKIKFGGKKWYKKYTLLMMMILQL